MRAVEQWAAIQEDLPEDWSEARLVFGPEGEASAAAAILAPLGPGRVHDELRIHLLRAGSGAERLRNALAKLDERRLWGQLRLVDVESGGAPEEEVAPATRRSLPDAWDELLATLAPDWSDVLCELELDSSDHLPRAALLGAPLNPTRNLQAIALRFRAGRNSYGTSPGMVRRCLERMEAEHITGRISVLIELSDADQVGTQGPVWRVGGRSV